MDEGGGLGAVRVADFVGGAGASYGEGGSGGVGAHFEVWMVVEMDQIGTGRSGKWDGMECLRVEIGDWVRSI